MSPISPPPKRGWSGRCPSELIQSATGRQSPRWASRPVAFSRVRHDQTRRPRRRRRARTGSRSTPTRWASPPARSCWVRSSPGAAPSTRGTRRSPPRSARPASTIRSPANWLRATPSAGRARRCRRIGSSGRWPRTTPPSPSSSRRNRRSMTSTSTPLRRSWSSTRATGKVSCDNKDLAEHAQRELDDRITARTAGDVTSVIQRLFDRHADLFRIRDQGGCYFVPAEHTGVRRADREVRHDAQRPPPPLPDPGRHPARGPEREGVGRRRAGRPDRQAPRGGRGVRRRRERPAPSSGRRSASARRGSRSKPTPRTSASRRNGWKPSWSRAPASSASGSRRSTPRRWCSSPTARSRGARATRRRRRSPRCGSTGEIKGKVAYKVWKVHPDTEVGRDGKFVHSKFAPAAGAGPRGRGAGRAQPGVSRRRRTP